MGQSEVPSLCHHLLAVLAILVIGVVLINNESANAQQTYNGDTYACSDSGATSCSAFALYRAQHGYTNLTSIASLFTDFNSTALAGVLGDLNNLPISGNGILTIGQPIIVPLACTCFNQTSYANLTHIIAAGDTFYDLNANAYEYLSTTDAIIEANPTLNYEDLSIGTPMIFPVRCACPSNAQILDGVTALVTYPVVNGDSTSQVAAHFGVPTDSIVNANSLPRANPEITEQTTLLVPINTTTPTYTTVLSPPASPPIISPGAPAPTSASGRHGNSKAGMCVVIAVWFSLALSF